MTQQSFEDIFKSFSLKVLPSYVGLYKHFHSHPELSNQEQETAKTCGEYLLRLGGFDLQPNIGGYGLAGVFRNGPGRTVLIRAEMDALPVLEQTGLPYASTVTIVDSTGIKQPVMHACGHDSPYTFPPINTIFDTYANPVVSAHDLFNSSGRTSGRAQKVMEWNSNRAISAS